MTLQEELQFLGNHLSKAYKDEEFVVRLANYLINAHDTFNKRYGEIKHIISGKTLKGDKGDKGHRPTRSELLDLIIPLIPKPQEVKDGHTPTKEDILALILPLIPEAKHGSTPSDEHLLGLIQPLIPKIEDKKLVIGDNHIEKIAKLVSKKMKPQGVAKVEPMDHAEILEKLIKEKKLKPEHVEGLSQTISALQTQMRKGYLHGGGDTVAAGSGIIITVDGNGKKTISAPNSPGTAVYEEIPTGSGTVFTLAHTPIAGTLRVYRGGARQRLGDDYTIATNNLTLSISLAVGEILVVDYNY